VKDFVHIYIYIYIYICIFQRDPRLTMFGTICLKTKRIAAEKNTEENKKKKLIRIRTEDPRGSLAMLQVVVNNCG
jgi:hypothetical protein